MRPVLRGVSLALASCLSLLASDARADPGPAAEYGVPYIEPVPEYGVEPVPLPEPPPEPPVALMVSGVVTNTAGKPVKGVHASLSGQVTATDGDGRYALMWPTDCAAPCEVVFTHKKYSEARVPLAVEGGPALRQADAVLKKR